MLCCDYCALAAGASRSLTRRSAAYRVQVHHHPNTLVVWWRLVTLLATRLPPHWLAPVLQPLLDSKSWDRVPVPQLKHKPNQAPKLRMGTWPPAEAPTATYKLGCLAAEMQLLAQLFAAQLPPPLVAPGLAAAAERGHGGGPVLIEVLVSCEEVVSRLKLHMRAQQCKLGAVLMHPEEERRRAARATPGANKHVAHMPPFMLPSTMKFDDVPSGHGGDGGRLQVLSAVQWVCPDEDPEGVASMCINPPPYARPGSNMVALRFWLLEGRLKAFVKEGWKLQAVSTDDWQALLDAPAKLSDARVVQRAERG